MAGLGVQDKISKINAELARLELEMELDHNGEGGYVGPWYDPRTYNFPSFGGGGEKTEDATGAQHTAFVALLKLVFDRIITLVSLSPSECTYKAVTGVGDILKLFKDTTGKAESGHLQVWDCSVGGRGFYVLMRVVKGAAQYSIIRSTTDIMRQKDFAKLEYSPGAQSGESDQRLFVDRIARAVVTGDDLGKIVNPKK